VIPACGREWIPTFPPASVEFFRALPPALGERPWTTVAHWYAGSEVEIGGVALRPKRDTFMELANLPALVRPPLLVACDLRPEWDDHRELSARGWKFFPSADVCRSPEDYRQFIAGSAGEIGVPKGGYVAARTGWLSDRSMVYLASGRPVVAMDTGWTAFVAESPGLRAFSTAAQAAACIAEIEADYDSACRSARQLAETVFSGAMVAERLLARLGIDTVRPRRTEPSPPAPAKALWKPTYRSPAILG
jgi:hypothetical protein